MHTPPAFSHPALMYRGEEEYLAGTLPFVRAGLSAGEPVAVAVPGSRLRLLRGALGAAADGVRFIDMTVAGRNPGWIIPGVLGAFFDAHPGRRVRVVGEPIWPGRSADEYRACVQHEALINLAFAGRPATILCPYDAGALDEAVVADAAVTHPVVIDGGVERPSPAYDADTPITAGGVPSPPPASAVALAFDRDALGRARAFAVAHARRIGMGGDRVLDLELAVHELVANAIVHGGGRGGLRVWEHDGHVVCEVADAGRVADPLAGRRPVGPASYGGRGLLLVNQIADLVRAYDTAGGRVTRVHFAFAR